MNRDRLDAARAAVSAWNAKYPVGTRVVYADREMTTRDEARVIGELASICLSESLNAVQLDLVVPV